MLLANRRDHLGSLDYIFFLNFRMELLGHWILAPNVPVPKVRYTALSSSVQSTVPKSITDTAAVRAKPN